MSIDLSEVFEQKLRSIKYKGKDNLQSSSNSTTDSLGALLSSLSSKSSFQRNTKQFKELSLRAKNLVETIADMKKFLIERRRDYIDMFSSLSNQASNMSDMERDQIDQDMVESMKNCQTKIESLKADIKKKGSRLSVQRRDTMTAIIESIETYLKVVCDLFSDLRAFRIRRITDKQKLARLDRDLFNKEPYPDDFIYTRDIASENFNDVLEENPLSSSKKNMTSSFNADLDHFSTHKDVSEFTEEELQIFEKENNKLFADINLLEAETKQIEGNVYEIAQLHKTFQQNFLQQDEEIQRVHGTAVETSSNIRVGNEELRSAIKNKGQLRIWILFVNIVLSFTLFFLDWYNP